jgi:transcriptional regulator with XRE-family HTH domain
MAETLGDRIRMHRARLRLSQRALGKQVGLSTNGISLIERGEVDPRVSVIRQIADVLGVSTDYLLGRTEDPTPPPKRTRSRNAAPVPVA